MSTVISISPGQLAVEPFVGRFVGGGLGPLVGDGVVGDDVGSYVTGEAVGLIVGDTEGLFVGFVM